MGASRMGESTIAYTSWDREWIGPAAIHGLKQLLANRLGGLDARERAAVFADALHRMVQTRLPALSEPDKVTLRIKLIQLLCSEKGSLTDRDVLEECLRLQHLTEEGFVALSDWVESRIGSKPALDELKEWALQVQRYGTVPGLNHAHQASVEDAVPQTNEHSQAFETGSASIDHDADRGKRTGTKDRYSTGTYFVSHQRASSAEKLAEQRVPAWFRHAAAALLFLALFGTGAALIGSQPDADAHVLAETQPQPVMSFLPAAPPSPLMHNGLPRQFQHRYVNTKQLQLWLERKQSKLAEEPYYSTMLDTAKTFNLHPYLLFAVSGQENGYVKTDHPDAEKIANNPFNVYRSWWEYNTDIADSSRIAAKTIVRLSWDQPEDVHPFQWINREYAEDPNWWKGVKAIFEQMERDIPLASP